MKPKSLQTVQQDPVRATLAGLRRGYTEADMVRAAVDTLARARLSSNIRLPLISLADLPLPPFPERNFATIEVYKRLSECQAGPGGLVHPRRPLTPAGRMTHRQKISAASFSV